MDTHKVDDNVHLLDSMAGRNLEDHLSGKEEGPTAILSRQSAWPHSTVLVATEVFRHLGYGRQASVTEARAQLDGLLSIPASATVATDEDFTAGHSTAKRARCPFVRGRRQYPPTELLRQR